MSIELVIVFHSTLNNFISFIYGVGCTGNCESNGSLFVGAATVVARPQVQFIFILIFQTTIAEEVALSGGKCSLMKLVS